MRIYFKDGVDFSEMDMDIWYAVSVVALVYEWKGARELVITSGRDGNHMKGSRHNDGRAVDIRTWNVPSDSLDSAVKTTEELLGSKYDVVLEATHLHIELA